MLGEAQRQVHDTFWRSATIFNIFRTLVAGCLLLALTLLRHDLLIELEDRMVFRWVVAGYLLLGIAYAACLRRRWPSFHILLSLQVASDIVVIVILMHLAGGFRTGIGIMLLPYLAAAGLISRGRTTLFHAAMASIALLLQQAYQMLTHNTGNAAEFFPPAMLSIACFATAWLAYRLATFASESQHLAEKRGMDLANMAQINRLVIQDVSDAVLVLDEQGVIHQFNQQAERLLGVGMQAGKSEVKDFCPTLNLAIAAWKRGEALPANLELYASRRTVRPRLLPIHTVYAQGGLVVFLEDLERVRREAQQLKLAALGRLTANIAHEIRNPLGAIGHAAQLLAEEVTGGMEQRLVNIINDNTRRLDRLVNAVLDLNRRDRAQPSPLRLRDWLESFIGEFREVEGINTLIELDCPQGVVVSFDEEQLHQVLWNLCRNGWRYCQKQAGSLRIVVASRADAWCLEVRDDGPGIPAANTAQLFEPFYTTDSGGNGLGLYIARELCAGNRSTLEYVPGERGARFRISFPSAMSHSTGTESYHE